MGKILESMGVIDGYDIGEIGKIRVKKDELFTEIEKKDKKIKSEVREIINNSTGEVFAIMKKGKIKGVYLFKTSKDDKKNLNLIKTVYTDEVKEETREKYNKHILELAKEQVALEEYNKVTFDDKVVEVDPSKSNVAVFFTSFGGFLLGAFVGWIIFHSLMWALIFGFLLGPSMGALENVVVTNKNKSKKKKKEE